MNHEPAELDQRLLSLLQAARDEGNVPARSELNEILRSNADARRIMARLLVDEQALIGRLRDESIVAILDEHSEDLAPTLRSTERRAMRWRIPVAAAFVLAVLGLAGRYWPRGGEPIATDPGAVVPEVNQVAVVTQVVDAQWDDIGFQANDRVPTGTFLLKAGLVRLQFLSGATLVIQGPAELDLTSDDGAEVRRGLVTANVPPVAEGFTLTAAGWRAVDRGTVFGIDARSPERTEVHVIEGKVDMHHGMDSAVRGTLTTGQTARLLPKSLVEQAASSTRFPREADVIDRAEQAERRQLEAWKIRSATTASDPTLVLYLDFEATDTKGLVVENRAPNANSRTHAAIIGCEWTQGRWSGKKAVAFQRVGDLLRTSLRTQLDAATFIVSLRIDPESSHPQTILLTPDVGPGQIYWLLAGRDRPNRGFSSVFIKTNDNATDLRFGSQRPLKGAELGQWHTHALVHDPASQRLRHYLDGVLVKENPLEDAQSLKLHQLVIGNWGFTTEPRNFAGRMDELAVFKRALSDEEIARF